jgi:hypothetical protein
MSPATPATAVSDTQLVLHPDLRLNPEQFALVCEANSAVCIAELRQSAWRLEGVWQLDGVSLARWLGA